jgi:dTDP-glucose pyrophosphorylase
MMKKEKENSMEDTREKAYKIVAYSAVSFSLLAIVAVCITMPIVYSFVEHIQLQTRKELEYCKVGKFSLKN